MDRATAQQKVIELVGKFRQQQEYYESEGYNEAQCREEFISPLFETLGWDVRNLQGHAPSLRDVVVEDHLRDSEEHSVRSFDYSFRVGRERIFIVEAKKPGVFLKEGKAADQAAYQLRRYGWNAGLAISIVTNFKEFVVYDCTGKPHVKDKANTARLNYLSLGDYTGQQKTLGDLRSGFDYLWEVFAKESVWQGGLEKYTQTDADKKGILTVDQDFLLTLEHWREELAKSIFRTNKELTEPELNLVVQQILNRILFLRIAEDRELEPYRQLFKAVSDNEVGRCYKNLYEFFVTADDKYDSGLFDTENDHVGKSITIDNSVIRKIVTTLYYPHPYMFSQIPVEILGKAYERFLGKTIRIVSGRYVTVEEKQEVRKAGGVYYTPPYIVNYIVENTVGKLLEGKTPVETAHIKIVDPACGSGSFLLGVYQYLLNWHRDYYFKHNPPSKDRKSDPLTSEGHLTIEEKKRILLNNVFGVDLDLNAVEITKLSLLLECMDGESKDTFQRLKLYHERLLPNIDGNICCGNSLIGTDIHLQTDFLLSEKEQLKINAFDWHQEFSDILKPCKQADVTFTTLSGFDIVIGNPPYGGALSGVEREYLSRRFNIGTTDTAALFLLQARKLAHADGKIGFIIPKALTYASNWQKVREVLLPDITHLADCGKVWNVVKLEMSICVLQQNNKEKTFVYAKRNTENVIETLGTQSRSLCTEFGLILNGLTKQEIEIGLKIKRNSKVLNDFVENRRGAMLQGDVSNKGNLCVLGGKQISRYYLETEKVKGKIFAKYVADEKAWIADNSVFVQNIVAHIARPSPHILLTTCPSSELENPKQFILLDTVNQLTMKGQYEPRFVSALLNSHLLSWYVYRFVFAHAIRTMHFDSTTTAKIPFPDIDRFTQEDKSKHNKIVRLVDRMLELKRKEHEVNEMWNWNVFHRQITMVDHEIDMLVYSLYGLSDAEIAIIEGSEQNT